MTTTSTSTTSRSRLALRHIASAVLLLLAVVCIGVGALSMWLKLQVLDTETWTETSRAAIQQPEMQSAVATWTVDQVFELTDPADALAGLLPPRAEPLAGPLTARLQTEAYDVAERVGVDPAIVDRIPERIATVEPQRSAELERGLKILRVLDRWGGVITFLSLPLLAAGIWMSPSRRRAWMWSGAGLIVVSLLLETARDAIGPMFAQIMAEASTWQAAILATWDVTTGALDDAAYSGIIVGVAVIAVAWSTGPSSIARSMRTALAPLLVRRPAASVGALVILTWVLMQSIPALESRRLAVQLVLLVGAAATGWILSRAAIADASAEALVAAATEEQTADLPAGAAASDAEPVG